jgi:hypothetical protein
MPESDPDDAPKTETPAGDGKKTGKNLGVRPPSTLGSPTDRATRPGFREPRNTKSKAQKKRK